MTLIDDADVREREWQAAIHGVDLSNSSTSRAASSSSSTGGGFGSFKEFYDSNFEAVFSKVVI